MSHRVKATVFLLTPVLLFVLAAVLIMNFSTSGNSVTQAVGSAGRADAAQGEKDHVADTALQVAEPASNPAHEPMGATEPTPEPEPEVLPEPVPAPVPTPAPEPDQATLRAIGDILLHQSVIDGGLQPDGTYRYDHVFADTRSLLSAADYTLANYEGTLGGPPYSGYPLFGGPDAIATAMREAGIDLAVTANNHSMDRKLAGLIRTPQAFAEAGIASVGTRSAPEDPTFVIEEIGGIQVGFTAWTWETIGTETQRAINGIPLPKEAEPLIDSFNPSRPARYAQDLDAMRARLEAMRTAGAECLVFIPHWGEEYVTASNRQQQEMTRILSDAGVDVIFGIHPHVLQEAELIHSEVSGKDTLVFYSLGGFLSNMDYGTHGTNGHALDAIIATATVARAADGSVRVVSGGYTGTTIVRETIDGKIRHRVLPVQAALSDPDAFEAGKWHKQLAQARLRTEKVFAKSERLPMEGIVVFDQTVSTAAEANP